MYVQVMCGIVLQVNVINGLDGSFEMINIEQFNDAQQEGISRIFV